MICPYNNTPKDYMASYGSKWLSMFKLHKKAMKDPDIYRTLYYKEVWKLTEANKILIRDIDKRGYRDYHIDHKVPISIGFINNILPKYIADVSNLHMMFWKDNVRKRDSLILDEENYWLKKLVV